MRALLVDISNSFTKFAVASAASVGRVRRIETSALTVAAFRAAAGSLRFDRVVLSSVVPSRNAAIHAACRGVPVLEVGPAIDLGVRIDYPRPESIGADRLANAAAVVGDFPLPAVVVDFGTAVTFDVIAEGGIYVGGVIAPGLAALTDYLHEKTALLPAVRLTMPRRAVGKSTAEAMLSGAVHGYRGLIREILARISEESFHGKKAFAIATGGDAKQLARLLPVFDAVAPGLTLDGLRKIAAKNPLPMRKNASQNPRKKTQKVACE